jgi:hypothetical protein
MVFVLAYLKRMGISLKYASGTGSIALRRRLPLKDALADVNVSVSRISSGILMFFKNAMRMGLI